jgi:hypothetical protein
VHAKINNTHRILASNQNEEIICGTWVYREGILKQIFTKCDVYKAARVNCIWFNLWIVGVHGKLLFQLHYKTLLTARVTAAELVHKAHTARVINSWRHPNQNKTEREAECLPPTPCLRIRNESLNIM